MDPSPIAASGYARCQGWCSVDEESRVLQQMKGKKSQGAARTKKEKIKYDFIKQQNINREEYLLGASADDKGKNIFKN